MTEAAAAKPLPTSPAPAAIALTGAPKPALNTTAFETTRVAFAKLHPSPLNPRKHFDDEKIAAIAESIFAEGVIQNLVVRRIAGGKNAGDMEIVAGETRYRAIALLIKQKRATDAYMVPVTVRTLTDEQVVELALIENMSRKDLTPMEEARALAVLRDKHKLSTEKIAERIGYTQRYVQQRLRLLANLTPEAQKALEEGTLTIEYARELAAAPPKMQQEFLKDLDGGYNIKTVERVRKQVQEASVPESNAIFDVAQYKGEWLPGEGKDVGKRFFGNLTEFWKLQNIAVAARVAKLKEQGAAWVKISRGGWFHDYGYDKKPVSDKTGVVVHVDPRGKVITHKGLVVRNQGGNANANAKPAKNEPKVATIQEEFPTDHLHAAAQQKMHLLQRVVAENPYHGLRLLCADILLSGRGTLALGVESPGTGLDETVVTRIEAQLKKMPAAVGLGIKVSEDGIDNRATDTANLARLDAVLGATDDATRQGSLEREGPDRPGPAVDVCRPPRIRGRGILRGPARRAPHRWVRTAGGRRRRRPLHLRPLQSRHQGRRQMAQRPRRADVRGLRAHARGTQGAVRTGDRRR